MFFFYLWTHETRHAVADGAAETRRIGLEVVRVGHVGQRRIRSKESDVVLSRTRERRGGVRKSSMLQRVHEVMTLCDISDSRL